MATRSALTAAPAVTETIESLATGITGRPLMSNDNTVDLVNILGDDQIFVELCMSCEDRFGIDISNTEIDHLFFQYPLTLGVFAALVVNKIRQNPAPRAAMAAPPKLRLIS